MGKQAKLKLLRHQQEIQEQQADQKANKLAGYFGLGLLAVIAIIGGSIYYFFFRHTPEPTASIDQQSSSLIENQSTNDQSNQAPNITAEIDNPLVNQVETETKTPKQYTQYPPMTIDQNKQYFATLKTSVGDIKIELFPKQAPLAVNNFVFLSHEGFYNGLTFHRIIKNFMIQGGDPLGNGTGGVGYQFKDEPNDKKLIRGSLAMANSGPDTNGSQFFIVATESVPWLDGKHTNFGMVDAGMQTVMDISEVATGPNDLPVKPVVINSIIIDEQ